MTCACACGCQDEMDLEDRKTCSRCRACRWTPTKNCRIVHRDNYTLTGQKYRRAKSGILADDLPADRIEMALALASKRRRKNNMQA